MNRFLAVICAGALAATGAIAVNGCQKSDSPGAGNNVHVAVVDLDKVAADLGWMKDLSDNLEALKKQFTTDLQRAKDQYTSEIQNKKLEFAPKDSDKLTPEQQQILQGMGQVAQQVLDQMQQKAGALMNNYRQQSVVQYRAALRPIVQQVAEDKGIWFVSERNDSVLYYDPEADVTDAVIDATRAHPPILTQVPMPQLPGAPAISVKLTTQPTTQPGSSLTPTTAPSI